eukprot:Colp12_sorted_trinity150504_noHs@3148
MSTGDQGTSSLAVEPLTIKTESLTGNSGENHLKAAPMSPHPKKTCPSCSEFISIAKKVCPCGHVFRPARLSPMPPSLPKPVMPAKLTLSKRETRPPEKFEPTISRRPRTEGKHENNDVENGENEEIEVEHTDDVVGNGGELLEGYYEDEDEEEEDAEAGDSSKPKRKYIRRNGTGKKDSNAAKIAALEEEFNFLRKRLKKAQAELHRLTGKYQHKQKEEQKPVKRKVGRPRADEVDRQKRKYTKRSELWKGENATRKRPSESEEEPFRKRRISVRTTSTSDHDELGSYKTDKKDRAERMADREKASKNGADPNRYVDPIVQLFNKRKPGRPPKDKHKVKLGINAIDKELDAEIDMISKKVNESAPNNDEDETVHADIPEVKRETEREHYGVANPTLGSKHKRVAQTLLGQRENDEGAIQFLVHWAGESEGDATWEDESALDAEIVAEFKNSMLY